MSLREGWTTGTCASAAAKAAVIGLSTGRQPATVEVALPAGRRVTFPVEWEEVNRCAVVKDAGDDPDCTDGARLTVSAEWAGHTSPAGAGGSGGGTVLRAGPGVGTVTLPGLGLPIGQPAITAVPRRMILGAVAEAVERGVELTLSVPGGEDMAARTTNARLGILGGISILGTSGIVRPFSTAAYRASVLQQVDVAAAQGERLMVLSTGARSEAAAMRLLAGVPEVCFVEVGDFTGITLRRAASAGMTAAVFVGMAGKIAKLAAGVMMTHFRRSQVDGKRLAEAARAEGAPARVVEAATATATARHFFEVCMAEGARRPLERLCRQARAACEAHVGGAMSVQVVMVDFDGAEVAARA